MDIHAWESIFEPGSSFIKIYWLNFEEIRFFFLCLILSYENSATYEHSGGFSYQILSAFTIFEYQKYDKMQYSASGGCVQEWRSIFVDIVVNKEQ